MVVKETGAVASGRGGGRVGAAGAGFKLAPHPGHHGASRPDSATRYRPHFEKEVLFSIVLGGHFLPTETLTHGPRGATKRPCPEYSPDFRVASVSRQIQRAWLVEGRREGLRREEA